MNAQQTTAQTPDASGQSATRSAAGMAKGFRKSVLLAVLFAVGILCGTAMLSLANTSAIAAQSVSASDGTASEMPARRVNANINNGVPVHAFRLR
jgi:hypothetical protein